VSDLQYLGISIVLVDGATYISMNGQAVCDCHGPAKWQKRLDLPQNLLPESYWGWVDGALRTAAARACPCDVQVTQGELHQDLEVPSHES